MSFELGLDVGFSLAAGRGLDTGGQLSGERVQRESAAEGLQLRSFCVCVCVVVPEKGGRGMVECE